MADQESTNQDQVQYCESRMFWHTNGGIWKAPIVATSKEDDKQVKQRAKQFEHFMVQVSKKWFP